MIKFNIGDTAWLAKAGQEQTWITCPECLGSGRLRVILGDDSEVSIECVCCERGYEGSPGKLQTYAFRATAEPVHITGVETRMHDGVIETRYNSGCWSVDEQNLYETRLSALGRADALVEEHEIEETKRLKYKEKQHKTWAWHVRYYRSCIRASKEQIARYEAKLAVAPKNRVECKEADKIEPTEAL
jgi:hypothetical protein